jgi:hypothetical protein
MAVCRQVGVPVDPRQVLHQFSPWSPGSAAVTVGGVPALDDSSQCSCGWGGSITITSAGQTSATDQ